MATPFDITDQRKSQNTVQGCHSSLVCGFQSLSNKIFFTDLYCLFQSKAEVKCKFWQWVDDKETINEKNEDEMVARSCEVRIVILECEFDMYEEKTN